MAKKKVTKKLEVVSDIRTHLTELEMLKIENHNSKVTILEYKQALLEKEHQLYNMAVDKKKMEISTERIKADKERKEYNENIKKEFNLDSKTWGYDPLTGEVK